MDTKQIYQNIRRNWRAFAGARGGNTAVIFGLALIPVVGLAGAAVDYSRANSARTAMQAAVDATALMLSQEAPRMATREQVGPAAETYFRAIFNRSDTTIDSIVTDYSGDSNNPTLTVTVRGHLATMLIRGMGTGQNRMDIGTSATISWGQNRLRVALVLDNSGSMGDSSKLLNLKTAARNLLTQLRAAALSNGDVYVSVIPFNNVVNVGSGQVNASWVDWTQWDAHNAGDNNGYMALGNNNYCYQGTQYYWNGSSFSVIGSCSMSARSNWNGCIQDRGTPTGPGTAVGYDQRVDAPVPGNFATLFPAIQASWCPVAMMGLSYDWNTLNTKIDSMSANGSTNQPIGLVWGWQSLVGGGPLTAPAKDPNSQYNEIIILLSDGLNTQDRWYGTGSGTSTEVDARMCTSISNGKCTGGTCKNVQDAGITMYAVQVSTSGDPLSTLLQACATDQNKFFFLTSSTQIVTTFQQIGTEISKLRISR